jgi:hypothetical protein
MTDNSAATAAPPSPAPIPAITGPVGIGGWLILPMLGLFATLGVQLLGLAKLGDVFGHLDALSSLQSNMIVLEFCINLALFLVAPIALLVLFFGKDRKFPRYYIIWQIVGSAFVVLDLMLGYALFAQAYEASGTPFFDTTTIRSLLGSVVGVCIWVPYMMNSVRVKNTFVN